MADSYCDLSRNVQDGLRRLGYCKQRAEIRVQIYNNANEGSTYFHRYMNDNNCREMGEFDVIMIGSRREGMAGFWESDTDKLYVPVNVQCIEPRCMSGENRKTGLCTFTMEYDGAPNGYTYLKLDSTSDTIKGRYTIYLNNCVEKDGSLYLTNNGTLPDIVAAVMGPTKISEKQSSLYKNNLWMNKDREHGPARPFRLHVPFTKHSVAYDNVLALKCTSHHIDDWCNSKHDKIWPSQETVGIIRGVGAHVVSIGVENTENECLQWRISQCLAELELVKSFNDTQIRVYGLMKIIGKSILETALKQNEHHTNSEADIPGLSYIIKNVMFWLSEEHTTTGFTEEQFAERVIGALEMLLTTMETGFLPNYIIPTRNTCSPKLTPEFREILATEIKDLLSEGFEMVKKIPCLREHIRATDIPRLEYQARRHQIEEFYYIAPLTLPPKQSAEIKQMFIQVKWPIQVFGMYIRRVLPNFLNIVIDNMYPEYSKCSNLRKLVHILCDYYGWNYFIMVTRLWFSDFWR